ncbi:uncharacterized protein N0V89_012218 [Didymosphaeria variabile]|uniref:Uncharacterized protein n=1 Tax=Didymosphaeria variabile TaxID=1932322 RepID=A0A9W9C570_9PLEO|nr:uncharacterized protein N0V89_012218 [Didymosphaeria variabile]KAJ4344476.1 hypothetical protein N0V89_012218 [Didymosphaeria variabile]
MNAQRLFRTSPPRIAQRLRPTRRYTTKPTDPAPPQPHPPAQSPNPNQAPPPPKKAPSRVGTFYRNNTYPVLKSFLVALFTYQLAFYVWLKLEVVEEKSEQQGAIRGLEEEVKKMVAQQKRNVSDAVGKVADREDIKPEEKKKKGWLW